MSDDLGEPRSNIRPQDAHERVAPVWRTASLVLGSLAALLTAMGPVSVWINGVQDRKLQVRKAQDDISLRYMDLLLRGFETPEERRATLTFLENALSAKRPSDLMLQVVRDQLHQLDEVSLLREQIIASAAKAQTIEEELGESEHVISNLRTRLASVEDSARADAAEREQLERQLHESERARTEQEQELADERLARRELLERLDEAKAAAGARGNPPTETLPTKPADSLREYFDKSGTPEPEQALLTSLDRLCKSHGGRGSITYYGPHDPGVSCFIDGKHVGLDEDSLEIPDFPRWGFGGLRLSGDWFANLSMMCSYLKGELVAASPYSGLCRLESGRGVELDPFY